MPPVRAGIDSVASAISFADAPVGGGTSAMFMPLTYRPVASGREGGNRTPNLRFWRPPLCQLSYCPVNLRDHLGHNPCADGFTALADGESQTLLHRDRRDQLHHDLD